MVFFYKKKKKTGLSGTLPVILRRSQTDVGI